MASRKFVIIALVIFFSIRLAASAQTSDEGNLELGARLFKENCAVCHGERGEGRIGANLAKSWPSVQPELTVRTIVENGIPGSVMPAWSQKKGGPLADTEIDALVLYVLSLGTGQIPTYPAPIQVTQRSPITPVPDVAGDPNHGAVLFDENCAVCHGKNGEGRIGATLIKAWPSIRPDLSIKGTIQRGILGTTMPAWSQANGGPLSEGEIDDIVSFILSRSAGSTFQSTPTILVPEPTQIPWLRGWGGILIFTFLMILIILIAILLQRKSE